MTRLDIFVSSTMNELARERALLYELLPQLGQGTIQLRPWVFEHSVKVDDRVTTQTNFMTALENSALCIAIFWREFGKGTEEEFNHALKWDIPLHIYVKSAEVGSRSQELADFLNDQTDLSTGFSSYEFKDLDALRAGVTRSTRRWMRDFLKNRRTEERAIVTDDFDDITLKREPVIGRDEQITQIMEKLRHTGPDENAARLLIYGFGGTGKTALAMTIAKCWLREQQHPIIWYVVGSSDSDELYEGLLKGLGLEQADRNEIMNKAGRDRLNSIRGAISALTPPPSLVVLDNAWNNQGLTGMLNVIPSNIPVLITSRNHFNIGEQIELDTLSEQDALALLSEHAAVDYRQDEGAKELCKHLDYLPFCIRIAGLNLKLLPQLSPAEYLERIYGRAVEDRLVDDDGSPLSEQDAAVFDIDPEFWDRKSMRQLLDASYNDLPTGPRRAFYAAGAFSIPEVTSALLAAYLDLPVEEVSQYMESLQVRGLVEPLDTKEHTAHRYRLHDLSFSYLKLHYARGKVVERVQRRSIEACIAYMEKYQLDADAVDAEIDNVLGAAQLALQSGNDQKLVRIIELFTVFNGYIETRGHSTRARRLLHQTFEDATSPTMSRLLDDAYQRAVSNQNYTAAGLLGGRIAEAHYRAGHMPEAVKQSICALYYARKAGDVYLQARICRFLGQIRLSIKLPDRRFRWNLETALRLAQEHNYPMVVMKVHESWGHYYSRAEETYPQAEVEFQKAFEICETLNDNNMLFFLALSLGGLKFKQGKLDEAEPLYSTAKLLAETINSKPRLGYAYQGFWEIADAKNEEDQAEKYLAQALTYYLEGEMTPYLIELARTASSKQYYIAPPLLIDILSFISDHAQFSEETKSAYRIELACAALACCEERGAAADRASLAGQLEAIDIHCT